MRLTILSSLLLLWNTISFAQSDTLTLEKCVEIAMANNPQIRAAEGGYEASHASLTMARSAYLPQISLQASATQNAGTFLIGPSAIPRDFQNYTTSFQTQQLIFDFGKTIARISASSDLVDASEQDYKSMEQVVVLNTNIAYFNYLQAQRVQDVNVEAVKQAEEHLRQAKGFYNAGSRPQFDVVKAEVDLANASVNLIRAENALKLGRIQLENVLGVKLPIGFALRDNLEVSQVNVDLNASLETAMQVRPEIVGSRARVEANKSLLTAAWTAHLPTVNVSGGYGWRGLSLEPLYNSWNVGLSFAFPIFQGWALDAGVDQARANLKTAEASTDVVIQSVVLDVQQQYFTLQEAAQRIEASRKLVEQSKEALKLAEGRYNSGIGSAVEITDAQVTLANARITYIQSLYDHRVAYARLQRAMGTIK